MGQQLFNSTSHQRIPVLLPALKSRTQIYTVDSLQIDKRANRRRITLLHPNKETRRLKIASEHVGAQHTGAKVFKYSRGAIWQGPVDSLFLIQVKTGLSLGVKRLSPEHPAVNNVLAEVAERDGSDGQQIYFNLLTCKPAAAVQSILNILGNSCCGRMWGGMRRRGAQVIKVLCVSASPFPVLICHRIHYHWLLSCACNTSAPSSKWTFIK